MNGALPNGSPRIGVYVCHCGTNIAGTVDIDECKLGKRPSSCRSDWRRVDRWIPWWRKWQL